MLKNSKKGFTLVEIAVVIAIMVVLLAVLAPSLLRYTENSRVQKDESAMDEVCNAIQLAMADSETFDEVCAYAIPNNYIVYSDSSGDYAATYTDEEYWAPDGSGHALTITFNPDDNGDYYISKGMVNDMTNGNGSVAETRVVESVKQCTLEEMGNQKLYSALKKSVGETFSEKSSTYKNSSYTVFIKLDNVNSIKRANVYGSFNGTNLSPESPAALGSGTSDYTDEGEAVVTKPNGGTTTPNFSSSDLSGGGSIGNNTDHSKPTPDENETSVVEILNQIKTGDKLTFANKTWTVVANETDTLFVTRTMLPNSGVAFDDKYEDGLHDREMTRMYNNMSEESKRKIALSTIGGFNTTNNSYVENGTDTLQRYIFTLSMEEVLKLPVDDRIAENEYAGGVWLYPRILSDTRRNYVTRTMSSTMMDSGGYHKFYMVSEDGVCPHEVWGNVCNYRPSLRLLKSEFTSVEVSQWGTTFNKLYKLDGDNGDTVPFYLGEITDITATIHCDDPLFVGLTGTTDIPMDLVQGDEFGQIYVAMVGFPQAWLCQNDWLAEELQVANPDMTFDARNEVFVPLNMNGVSMNIVAVLHDANGRPVCPEERVTADANGQTYTLSFRTVNYDW